MGLNYKKRLYQLYAQRNFILSLSKKALKVKYSGSKLGLWWALILPLLLALSINLVFTKAFNILIPNYTLFVLSAILPWLFFAQSLTEATNSFSDNSSMLKQCIFLREIIPFSSILGNFLNFLLGLAAIIPLFILFNYKIVFFLPALISLVVFFLIFLWGVGIIFSLMNVFYKDVSCFLSLALMIWFWITPIFYSLEMIPYPYSIVCLVNPLTYYILTFRDLLYYGRLDLGIYLIDIIISFAAFFAGHLIFILKEKELLKRA